MRKFSRRKTALFLVIIYTVFVSVFYGGYVIYRAATFYVNIKYPQRGMQGRVYRFDPELGFAPIPNSQGAHVLPPGPNIPIRYDADGFRIPRDDKADVRSRLRPLVLALGCSYTYGDACTAEDAYPYLVGKQIGGSSINAGGCAYGLSHMVILARRLLPTYKPDYLLVQYSPWLVPRAQSFFVPSFYGKITNPFYFERENTLRLSLPIFRPIIIDLPIDQYKTSTKGVADCLSFLTSVGIPLGVYEDIHMLLFRTKRRLGFIPSPSHDESKIIQTAYGEIARLAQTNGARMIVVVLGCDEKPLPVPKEILALNPLVANAHAALLGRLPEKTLESYAKRYVHWNGSPPVVVDAHPNPSAHKIIAEEIVNIIKAADNKK
jgi:hypothetical protein